MWPGHCRRGGERQPAGVRVGGAALALHMGPSRRAEVGCGGSWVWWRPGWEDRDQEK